MTLLAGTNRDPASSVNQVTTSLLAMTALDTTNLRLTFTVPANGAVRVRMRGMLHGSASNLPSILLGVLESSTVKGRVTPIGGPRGTALATTQMPMEANFVVPGLTPAANLTWDAAIGVEQNVAATGLKWGGPNDTTTDNAFGGFAFDIWEVPNLLGAALYDPSSAVNAATSSRLAMTALDTTNLRKTFTCPASGKVLVRMFGALYGATTYAQILLGILDGATVRGRQAPIGAISNYTGALSIPCGAEACFIVNGLTPGNSYTWDAAWGIEILNAASSVLRYGGPNDTTATNAGGAFGFEILSL